MNNTKLELTWIGKDTSPRLEPRILLENTVKSYHANHKIAESDIFDNKLIFGDNLLALKALESEFSGKIKCIYIDPPFNTKQAFEHYDDGIEHSLWLSLMKDRLTILKKLLSRDGVIWVHCDDNEHAYLKVMMDEIFGRSNFITNFIWQKVDSPSENKKPFYSDHDYILCYASDADVCKLKQKPDSSILDAYRKPDEESSRPYRDRLLKKNGKSSLRKDRPSMYFPITAPDGTEIYPVHDDGQDARWACGQARVSELVERKELVWKLRDEKWIPYTREYAPLNPTKPYPTIWCDVQTSRQSKAHLKTLHRDVVPFDTPKPEPLLDRIIEMSTNKGDIVLDSFGGSGTTGAVAHKMGRKWIMVELGDHCHTHIIPRMQKVIDGEDQGGISKAVNWQGGGGFRYYSLAPSLLEKDQWDNWVINKDYKPEMLAEAICKLEGFTYSPSETEWWNHGYSTETDFITVTTQNLSIEKLEQLSEAVGSDRTLLVCCTAFRCNPDQFANLTIKKIPKMVLNRCEWAHDDYSLNVQNLPMADDTDEQIGLDI
ncbi:site-specific DNA-methyltransferase [Thalassotalea atypica]|uniref:site-specific DNA-methyltransferase n=1 Tax=Thalassotalea atypica TaxID=2054316 RepID=UPI0025722E46|nr:site-specific DNA-methyltransferase [Thalassotalea atypica]